MTTSPSKRRDRPYKPKLIEVAIPLEDINKESAREKSIRHGHPSTLHLWWARRPLAACRAVLFAQLVDDPSAHPEEFPSEEAQVAERERLFGIIRRLVKWENIHDEGLYKEARAEIWKSCDGNPPPPILDPFAGGGSIPLEAQRLGLEAYASDLNPVAVLINKALIEIPPKWAGQPPVFPGAAGGAHSWPGSTGLAEDVRKYGKWMRDEAEKRIGHLYPTAKLSDGTDATVIAWIWARTVTCPNPACSGLMPLLRSFWLGKKRGKERYVHPVPDGNRVRFEIRGPQGVPREGTVGRTGAACLLCGTPVPLAYIRAEGKAGRLGTQLMAVAAEGTRQRYYLPPSEEHEKAADADRPDDVPDAEIPHNPRYLTAPNYGMRTWADLFTSRQLVMLTTFNRLVSEARKRILTDGADPSYADAISVYLSFALSKVADNSSSLCTWMYQPSKEGTAHTFGRAALPMVWDFAEGNPFRPGPSDYAESCIWIGRMLVELPRPIVAAASVNALDASEIDYRDRLVATDPPYYDNVPYADISDFFYIWLRLSLMSVLPELFATVLTPKKEELVADPVRQGGQEESERFFLEGFSRVFARIRKSAGDSYPISVFYGFKQSESDESGHASTGWETLLEAMIASNWQVTATWPMRTERIGRVREIASNALASSIVLACRPREETAAVTDRRGLIAALREELPLALRKLQQGSIAPVDLQQAAIGPGMAVFSRYARVNEPDGQTMRVRTALVLINQVLDEVLSEQEGDFGADTRWCVEWFKSYGFDDGPFGVAETLSKAKNTSVNGLEHAGVVKSRAGKVRLVSIGDLAWNYDPADDERVSEWEIALHLAKRLHAQGGVPAATLMAAARDTVDLGAVKELAYLLFSIAEKKGWTETAQLFNGLGTSWSDLASVASSPAMGGHAQVQGQLDLGADDE